MVAPLLFMSETGTKSATYTRGFTVFSTTILSVRPGGTKRGPTFLLGRHASRMCMFCSLPSDRNRNVCTHTTQVTVYMNSLIRNSSELETYVVSVERVDEYANVLPEVRKLHRRASCEKEEPHRKKTSGLLCEVPSGRSTVWL